MRRPGRGRRRPQEPAGRRPDLPTVRDGPRAPGPGRAGRRFRPSKATGRRRRWRARRGRRPPRGCGGVS
ncbi:MAG TPA: hypothetical protein DCG66_07355 [Brevundimonas sp.]|nr:hypothetical protein [Brevundimonas sp.]